jgi:hypothetical protein
MAAQTAKVNLPFTLKFATPVNKASFTTKEAVEELKYDAKQQLNLASVNPSMAYSACSQDSKSTGGRMVNQDWDTDRTKDD